MSTQSTSFGTTYLPLEAYTEVNGVMRLCSGVDNKTDATSSESVFVSIGFTPAKAAETVKNTILSADLLSFIKIVGDPIEKAQGQLLYDIASKNRSFAWLREAVPILLENIKAKKIANKQQLDAAYDFFKKGGDPTTPEFITACGIGVVIKPEAITAAVLAAIAEKREELLSQRYRVNVGQILAAIRTGPLFWSDAGLVKQELDSQILALLGPVTDADNAKPEKKKKDKVTKDADTPEVNVTGVVEPKVERGAAHHFHPPGGNDQAEGYVKTEHTKRLLAEHLSRTGGKVITRFPPEPNGILHIGHAKAINFNFSYAIEHNGVTNLRYDDTNPEKEEEEFFIGIQRDVEWLGYKPHAITYSSDNFQKLYDYAVFLIKNKMAYVCHQTAEALKGHATREFSPWRERPVEESLRLFEDMRAGKIDEGKATLRVKHIMDDGKLDFVAYRVRFAPHHRTKDDWCIYPTYDYTHCICDSIEDITHSLCTKEFQNRRASYYWLNNALQIYCPVQWEYSRLAMSYTICSKRKIAELIKGRYVDSWDDPRLFTISALRRRGFPPKAINDFCAKIGVTEATTVVSPAMLESCVRLELNNTAVRAMAVLEPLRVEFLNLKDFHKRIPVPNNPTLEAMGTHEVDICSVCYIDASDFMETPVKGYRRLTPSQPVLLKHVGLVIAIVEILRGSDGTVTGLRVDAQPLTEANKPKGFIHWVSSARPEELPQQVEVRYYSRLFKSPNPEDKEAVPNGYLSDIAENTLKTYRRALVDSTVKGSAEGTVFQFERVGYFCVDKDSTAAQTVFNLTIELKEDIGKNTA